MKGCGVALCIDLIPRYECLREKTKGSCNKGKYGDTDYVTNDRMTNLCAKTCDRCTHLAPNLCSSSEFGCCWDKSSATGPLRRPGIECPACRNSAIAGSYCRRHSYQCSTARGARMRKFLVNYCPKTCNICA
ncbi:hypothetical protein AC249_AIPGENE16248 [Exaiptasia diaphana]|nr:hypothetical protein AC249_AIPGENE16248 [Exaiptasia diaphana]